MRATVDRQEGSAAAGFVALCNVIYEKKVIYEIAERVGEMRTDAWPLVTTSPMERKDIYGLTSRLNPNVIQGANASTAAPGRSGQPEKNTHNPACEPLGNGT
jgi:hypothetical protein